MAAYTQHESANKGPFRVWKRPKRASESDDRMETTGGGWGEEREKRGRGYRWIYGEGLECLAER